MDEFLNFTVLNGIVDVPLNTDHGKIRAGLKDFWARTTFDQIFIPCAGLTECEAAATLAEVVKDMLNEAGIQLYEPVIVSIADVPEDERNRSAAFLEERDIPVVALAYNEYAPCAYMPELDGAPRQDVPRLEI